MKDKFLNFYMSIAKQTATLSYCIRRQVGAIIVDSSGKNIISYGYNGTVYGAENCCEDRIYLAKSVEANEKQFPYDDNDGLGRYELVT